MGKVKKLLTIILFILCSKEVYSYSISAGVSGGPANLTTSSNGGSIDVNLYFGSGVTRFGLGGKKIFYSESLANQYRKVKLYSLKEFIVGNFFLLISLFIHI